MLENEKRVVAIDPGPHLGMVYVARREEGYKVVMRKTYNFGTPKVGKKEFYYLEELARWLADPSVRHYFDICTHILIEKQFHQPGMLLLPSVKMMYGMVTLFNFLFPGKVQIISAKSIKDAFFKTSHRATYEKRKAAAAQMAEPALLAAEIYTPGDRLHDQADAYLLVAYFLNIQCKQPHTKLSANYRKPKPKPVESDTEEEPIALRKVKRRRITRK